jgi:hypothetical protein
MIFSRADIEDSLKWATFQYRALPFYLLFSKRAIQLRKRIRNFRKLIVNHGS